MKTYFDEITAGSPMPDRIAQLAAALEAALENEVGDTGICSRKTFT